MNLLWALFISCAVSPEFERTLWRLVVAWCGAATFMTGFWLLVAWLRP